MLHSDLTAVCTLSCRDYFVHSVLSREKKKCQFMEQPSDNNVIRNVVYEYNGITTVYIIISAVKCVNISSVLRQYGGNA
jgi:hypothetical protein